MKNRISQVYNAIDSAIMNVVGKGVRAYNWTTGDTKAGLANKMLSVAPILETTGIAFLNGILLPLVITSSLLISHREQKRNNLIEDLERKAVEKNCLDLNVEAYKGVDKLFGAVYIGFGGLIQSSNNGAESEFNILFGTAQYLRGLSCYVIRTDYLPPKKGFVERGIEGLAKLVKSYQAKPELQPALANRRDLL